MRASARVSVMLVLLDQVGPRMSSTAGGWTVRQTGSCELAIFGNTVIRISW
jgi:hypothetical protein